MLPIALVNVAPQPMEYVPPVTLIAAGAAMPVMVTAADVIVVESGTLV